MSHCDLCRPNACLCRCGYRCGGPGTCKDPDCLQKKDGEHFVRECHHDFSGEMEPVAWPPGCHSTTCIHCGMDAMAHDMRVGP